MGLFSRLKRRSSGPFASRVPKLRWFGPLATLIALICGLYMVVTGRIDFSVFDQRAGAIAQQPTGPPVTLTTRPTTNGNKIRVATFNIQTFGNKKSSTRELEGVDVMGTIARIVSSFDLVAIQEVRSQDGTPIQRLVDLLNANGGTYTAIVSEPIGGKRYTESYAFVWDSSRISFVQNSDYVVQDNLDRMSREPMVASFQTRVPPSEGQRPFRFTLINAHTDPDEVSARDIANEINVLDDVYMRVKQWESNVSGEDDYILLGDLNVDINNLQELAMIPNLDSVAGNAPTNTRKSATYDHILLDRIASAEFTGVQGVIDWEKDLGLTQRQALLISDHMPVWAEFSIYESSRVGPVASRPTIFR